MFIFLGICAFLFVAAVIAAVVGGFYFYAKVTQPVDMPLDPLPAVMVDPSWLQEHVEMLVNMSPRNTGRPAQLEAVAMMIAKRFKFNGAARVRYQLFQAQTSFTSEEKANYYNVIAEFGPPQLPNTPMVVVGAHYDACEDTPGADDNASGIAGLIELITLLAHHPKPDITVQVVAYPNEESPHFGSGSMGSAVHSRDLKRKGIDLRAAIVLEMIGYYSDAPRSQNYPLNLFGIQPLSTIYGNTGNFIGVVGHWRQANLVKTVKQAMQSISGLRVEAIAAPQSLVGVSFSDHASYWRDGFPAVMITDTAFYRNHNYHQKTDTVDTLDYDKMAVVVEQVHAAVAELIKTPVQVETAAATAKVPACITSF